MSMMYSPSKTEVELAELRDALETANKRIAHLSHVVKCLAREVKHIGTMSFLEIQHVERKDANERRIMKLELENALLAFERRLPPPKSKEQSYR